MNRWKYREGPEAPQTCLDCDGSCHSKARDVRFAIAWLWEIDDRIRATQLRVKLPHTWWGWWRAEKCWAWEDEADLAPIRKRLGDAIRVLETVAAYLDSACQSPDRLGLGQNAL